MENLQNHNKGIERFYEKRNMQKFTPFSNGTEYMSWQSHNCDQCIKYESESKTPDTAGCKLAFYIDLACVSDGTIPIDIANQIGITNNNISSKCNLIQLA